MVNLVFVEKPIVDSLRGWMIANSYIPSKEESACIAAFERSPTWIVTGNFAFWGLLGYYTLDLSGKRRVPTWMKGFGATAIVGGLFASLYLTAKSSHRSCLQCLVDVRDKKSALYRATREVLRSSHPDAEAYFKREKYRLLAIPQQQPHQPPQQQQQIQQEQQQQHQDPALPPGTAAGSVGVAAGTTTAPSGSR